MTLQAGQQLGPYKIIAAIGVGGMGEVYRARDPRLERDVAIKILPERIAADAEALARFQREAKAVAALAHPNILAIHDVGTDRGITFLVMELLEGQTLRERLRRTRPPWRKAVEQAIAIADGLTAAHAKSIVHRDLKPDNIFITIDGVVKILDFGLAEAAKSITPRRTPVPDGTTLTRDATPSPVAGTLGYMSPEQVRGEAVDARSDIFAFGCVLYEVLTGRRTFTGETAADTMSATLKDYPPAPTVTGADIPPELERIVMRCLEKDPQDRFFSAHDLAIALRDMLADSGRYQPTKASSRRRWIAPTIAAVGLAVVALVLALDPGGLRERLWPGARDATFKRSGKPATTPAKVPSLAVLPFANDSGDEELVYLTDGIAETLINGFSRLEGLNTIPRSSAFRHRGKDVDSVQAGRELSATAVLSGRVLKRGEDLTIQAELVDVAEGRQLWGDRYQRKFADLVMIEREIAREITDALRLRLTGEQERQLSRGYSENTEAYRFYLQGRFWWSKRTKEGFDSALRLLNQAVELDPDFALAYTGMADTYSLMPVYGLLAPREALARARPAAERALRLDEGLAEAHTSRAMVRFYLEWDIKGAERDLDRAMKLNPRYATAHLWYGLVVAVQGRTAEGRAELCHAIELDPLVPNSHHLLGWVHFWERNWEGALARYKAGLEFAPEFPWLQMGAGSTLLEMGRSDEAMVHLRRGYELVGAAPFAGSFLAYGLARTGHEQEAHALLAEGLELSSKRYVPPAYLAYICVGLGDLDEAFEWLEKAYEVRDSWLLFLGVLPAYDPLRYDPRYDDLLRRIGLDPAAYPKPSATAVAAVLGTGATAVPAVPSATQDALLKGSGTPPATPGKIASLAVLPLRNISGDPAQEPFADEMTEALSTALGQISALDVRSSQSTLQFKGSSKPVSEIAGVLKVEGCLEGSVQRSPERVVLLVRLIHAATERQLWAQRYDRPLTDVLILESELARTVADEIQIKLTPQERRQLTKARAIDPAAHEAYVLGRHHWNKRTEDGLKKSIAYFEQAIERDPDYALAYAGLADTYDTLGSWSYMPNHEAYPKAKDLAQKALTIDPTLGEAYITLASVLNEGEWNFVAAEREFRRGVELAPNYASGHQYYAQYLDSMGRHNEALAQAEHAVRLDPLSPMISYAKGAVYYDLRQYDQAVAAYRHALELDPHLPIRNCLAWLYGLAGQPQLAIAEYEADLRDQCGATTEQLAAYRQASASGGLPAARRWYAAFLEQRWPLGAVDATNIAAEYAALGDADRAFAWLDRACAQRGGMILDVNVDPMFDPLRSDPRFDDLLRRIGLPRSTTAPAAPQPPATPPSGAGSPSSASPKIASLAVLPLENRSGDPDQEYFADGMTEALIGDLGQISALERVISFHSMAQFKGTRKPAPQIGHELNVDGLLEGSVQRSPERLIVRMQLIHAPADKVLWSKTFDKEPRDVLALQGEIARTVAQEIQATLTRQEQKQLAKARPVDPQAHELYLKGRYYWNKQTGEALEKSLTYFQQAIDKDPGYALAYAGLADAYGVLGGSAYLPSRVAYEKAKAAALKALELNDTLAGPHAQRAADIFAVEWDWEAAEREFKLAIELDPGHAMAHNWYGQCLSGMGRHEEAIAEIERARELDPLLPVHGAVLGWVLNAARQYDRAKGELRKAFGLDPTLSAHDSLGWSHEATGEPDEAMREYAENLKTRLAATDEQITAYHEAYASGGLVGARRWYVAYLETQAARRSISAYEIATQHALLREADRAFEWLEKAYEQRDQSLMLLLVDARWDGLRSEPRYERMWRKIGLWKEHPPLPPEIRTATSPASANPSERP